MDPLPVAVPDHLGEDWVSHTLLSEQPHYLAEDAYAPEPVVTLVHRKRAGAARAAVLYVHGFSDYFFQMQVAQFWESLGFDFYAVDLHDYGRSIRPGRAPNEASELAHYFPDLDLALAGIHELGSYPGGVSINAHSTGGLIAALYLAARRPPVRALALNSPWLGLNARTAAIRALALAEAAFQGDGGLGSDYGRSLHRSTGGDFDYNLEWKPLAGFATGAAWLRAVRRGHAQVRRGLALPVPVLVATSGRSGHPTHPTELDLSSADCVLDVTDMWKQAPRLGSNVSVVRVRGGRHDLALSGQQARERYFSLLQAWVGRHQLATS